MARRIAEALGFPHVELDALHWEPGWEEAPVEVFRERVSEVTRGSPWVVDGNYGKVRDIVWGRADTVVWLDYGFPRIFLRLLWRTLRRVVLRERLWNDNREDLTAVFGRTPSCCGRSLATRKIKRNIPNVCPPQSTLTSSSSVMVRPGKPRNG